MADEGNHAKDSISKEPIQLLPEPANGLDYYLKPSYQTIDECSVYRLLPEERFLIEKYCRDKGTILDLACGLGRTTLCMHELGLPVIGVDFSKALIQLARQRFPYLDFRVGSLTETGEPDSFFNAVFVSLQAIDLLFPLNQRVIALREWARILRPGGVLIYSSNNVKCLHMFAPRYWRRHLWKLRRTLKAFSQFALISDDGIQGIFAAPEAVIAQTEEAGFRFLEMRGRNMSSNLRYNRYSSTSIYYAFCRI